MDGSKGKHPDFELELERLNFTKQYMDIVIQASESTEEVFRENVKKSLEGIDFKDSSFSYMSMLTNSNLLRRTSEEVRSLKHNYSKPYFARVDFKQEGKKEIEQLYFGKVSLFDKETQKPIIVDWRSQIANLYYDGRIGDVSYDAEGGKYKGYLSLKRQYIIEQSKLNDIRDIDLTTRDDLLQQSLSQSASNRLTDIVSTIQEEQNEIIRADLNKPIIVQGAAGSGKTTIALHRISYFIYTYAEHFSPSDLMILAPNRLFIDYISEVLPELGVDRIMQTTFIDFVKECIGKKIKMKHPDEKLIQFINRELDQPEQIKWISSFKGSLQYRDIIDQYLKDILKTLLPKEDFYLWKHRLYKAKDLQNLMINDYNYLPYYTRIDKVKKVLQNHVRTEKKNYLNKVTTFYDDKMEHALFNHPPSEKRRNYVLKAMDKKEEAIEAIKKQSRTAVNTFIKKLPKADLFTYYKRLVTNKELLSKYAGNTLTEEQIHYFVSYEQNLHTKRTYEQEDLAALLYMQYKLYGIDKDLRAKNVVIDEAQDYSYFQLYSLKQALETDMFTIVGDLAQGIHSYRGIDDWNKVHRNIFPRASYKTLQKSYRTTVEIMNAANDILKQLHLELPKVEPVVRHGEKPKFHYRSSVDKDTIKRMSEHIVELYGKGMKTIAIIGKNEKECNKIHKLFRTHSSLVTQLLKENQEINKDDVVIVSSHLSKGLEFDAVIVCSFNEIYEQEEIDIKLLYVSMTRPLHHLAFYGNELSDFLLDKVDLNSIQQEIVLEDS